MDIILGQFGNKSNSVFNILKKNTSSDIIILIVLASSNREPDYIEEKHLWQVVASFGICSRAIKFTAMSLGLFAGESGRLASFDDCK